MARAAPWCGMELWAFLALREGREWDLWICDSRESAEAIARKWAEERFRLVGFSRSTSGTLQDDLRILGELGAHGTIERHALVSRQERDSPFV